MNAYMPVNCDFHDQLEAIATLRQTCRIVYRGEATTMTEVEGRIVDIYAADHADFINQIPDLIKSVILNRR